MPACPGRTGPPIACPAAARSWRAGHRRTAASPRASWSARAARRPGRRCQAVRPRPGTGCSPPFLRLLAGVEDAQGDDVCQGAVVVFAVIPCRRNLLAWGLCCFFRHRRAGGGCRPGPGGCLPVPPLFPAAGGSLFGLVEQGRGGPGDLGLGDRVLAAAGEHLPGLVPCLLAKRRRGGSQVSPGGQDPAAVAEVVTDPHARDVV